MLLSLAGSLGITPVACGDVHMPMNDTVRPVFHGFEQIPLREYAERAYLDYSMHLGLRAPNIWFRARLRYPDARAEGGRVDIAGFTLPGMPAVVVGSNTQVAWGFTNSYIDSADWGRYARCGVDRYRIGAACTQPAHHRETIAVADGAPVAFDVEETPWGPVMAHDDAGAALALRWSAHLSGSLRLAFMDMAQRLRLADRPARPSLVGRSGARALPIGQHPSALPHPRRSSLIDVFDRVFASTCFTITAQYSECVPSADGNDPDTTTEPGGT